VIPLDPAEKVPPSAMADKNKILVVEDNDFVRMQIVRYLGDSGAEIIEASQGEQAIEYIRQQHMKREPITIAIVDVRMEPVDGFDFIRSIRGMDMDTPVILVTGDNNPDLLEQAGIWGVSAVMIKPVQKDRLLKTVTRTMEAYKRKS
jgi:CheY-like chemotaxis protein